MLRSTTEEGAETLLPPRKDRSPSSSPPAPPPPTLYQKTAAYAATAATAVRTQVLDPVGGYVSRRFGSTYAAAGDGAAGRERGMMAGFADYLFRPRPREDQGVLLNAGPADRTWRGWWEDWWTGDESATSGIPRERAWERRVMKYARPVLITFMVGIAFVVLILTSIVATVHTVKHHGETGSTSGGVITGPYADAPVSSATSRNPMMSERGCPRLHPPPVGKRWIQIHNNCKETIWPGIIPPGSLGKPPDDSWAWEPGQCKTMVAPEGLPALRVWGRTHCDEKYQCVTGSCLVDGTGMCGSAGEAPCSLWEATLQPHCSETPAVGLGPDFYDQSLVDGYNLPIGVKVSGGYNVGQVPPSYSCQHPASNTFDKEQCPFELRVYSDQIPGTNLPQEGLAGVFQETSPCFKTPLNWECQQKVVGCRSLCKSVDQGWIGFYIDNVEGPRNLVDPIVTRPNGMRMRWSKQFLQDKRKCGIGRCKDLPAWGAFRGHAYNGGGRTMKNLVCCDEGFHCSPYQINGVPGGCPYQQACPTLGAADPMSQYHRMMSKDMEYPQADQAVRMSSSYPDWPLPTRGTNYAKLYKDSSPAAYSWQFNDASSTYMCCGKTGEPGPSYIITFCP